MENRAEPVDQRARTKIVATVGPACESEAMLARLASSGVDVFRLNMAHGTRADHDRIISSINSLSARQRPLAILVDLAGPKIRLGQLFEEPTLCHAGEEFSFVKGEQPENERELTASYERLVDELRPGNDVMLADGTVRLVVTSKTNDRAICRVAHGGEIRSRQGVNLPGAKLSIPSLTRFDRECVAWAAGKQVDYIGLSFVREPGDVNELRELLRSHGAQLPVLAKIEKPEALEQLDAVVNAADAIMVARGDLGVEIDIAEVPSAQKRIIATCNRYQRPVIVATQMLDSMQRAPRPTRAEASDVANAILDGADACMLSGETAIGKYPITSVEVMNRIILRTEQLSQVGRSNPPVDEAYCIVHPITRSVVYGAARIAEQVRAKLVVIATSSGETALAKSTQRDYIPTIAVSESEPALRRMCLWWGITPLPGAPCTDSKALLEFITQWGRQEGTLAEGDTIVVVTGTKIEPGVRNQVVVHQVD